MALKRFTVDGYGQLELNNVAFRRDGRVEAQCALSTTDFEDAPAENGMLLAVDNVTRTVKFATGTDLPVALNYTTEHMYDDRHNALKDFCVKATDDFMPRLGYLAVGDKFTTNCVCDNQDETGGFKDDAAVVTAAGAIAVKTAAGAITETPLYGTTSAIGAIQLTATKPTSGIVLLVTAYTTMPDGTPGFKFQVLAA